MRREGGFTLIELMVVVAIIAIIATIAIPSFFREGSKAKAEAEVGAMFAEFRVRQEQYHLENGRYQSTGTSETDTWPTTPNRQRQDITPLPASWTSLRMLPPEQKVACSYITIGGGPGDPAGTRASNDFDFTPPSTDWYYVLAHCDMDGDSALDGYFFTSSVDTAIKKLNPSR